MNYLLQTMMPIIMNNNGGKLPPEAAIGLIISLNIFIAIGLIIRFLLIRKNEYFNEQSAVKNFFFDLKDLSFMNPNINPWTIAFLIVNCSALIVASTVFFARLIK